MRLWTVQHRASLKALAETGELTGDWTRVDRPSCAAYEVMVAEMARRGIDCFGRAPMWAWAGPDTRDDRVALTADLLLCPETPNDYARYVVLGLDVPDHLVVLSSYGRWNDFLEAVIMRWDSPVMDWSIDEADFDESGSAGVQACLPYVSRRWIQHVRRL